MRRTRIALAAVVVLAAAGTATSCTRTAPACIGAVLDARTVTALQDDGHAVTYSGRGVWAIDGTPVAVSPWGEDVDVPVCLSGDLAREFTR